MSTYLIHGGCIILRWQNRKLFPLSVVADTLAGYSILMINWHGHWILYIFRWNEETNAQRIYIYNDSIIFKQRMHFYCLEYLQIFLLKLSQIYRFIEKIKTTNNENENNIKKNTMYPFKCHLYFFCWFFCCSHKISSISIAIFPKELVEHETKISFCQYTIFARCSPLKTRNWYDNIPEGARSIYATVTSRTISKTKWVVGGWQVSKRIWQKWSSCLSIHGSSLYGLCGVWRRWQWLWRGDQKKKKQKYCVPGRPILIRHIYIYITHLVFVPWAPYGSHSSCTCSIGRACI